MRIITDGDSNGSLPVEMGNIDFDSLARSLIRRSIQGECAIYWPAKGIDCQYRIALPQPRSTEHLTIRKNFSAVFLIPNFNPG